MSSQSIIIDHQARGASTNYPLKQDVLQGFRDAVTNNQVTLAMEYLRFIVDELLERVAPSSDDSQELLNRIAVLEDTVSELKAALPAKRAVAKKAEAHEPE